MNVHQMMLRDALGLCPCADARTERKLRARRLREVSNLFRSPFRRTLRATRV